MNPSDNGKKAARTYSKHGLVALKGAMKKLGSRALDRRTSLYKNLDQWRRSLILDLGGKESISVQQESLVDLAVKSKLILDSIDTWILTQPTLINARRRSILPVVLQRNTLADSLARILKDLGLEKRSREKSLEDMLKNENTD